MNAEEGDVKRMFEFRDRHEGTEFGLKPDVFIATVPGVDEPFLAVSLKGLMDKLECWSVTRGPDEG